MSEQPYFMNPNLGDFGKYVIEDEYLHPRFNSEYGYELTETHFFGFSVPEAKIHSILYCWHHPNMKAVSGGVHVFQGIKAFSPGAEIYDYRYYLEDKDFVTTFPTYEFPSSYKVEMLEEGTKFRTTYADPARNNAFDVVHTAVSDIVMWPGDKHFEQVMKTEGEVIIRGKRYAVDGFHVRDRSWGQPRPETPFIVPPHAWVTAVFDGGATAFHLTATDDPSRDPVWKDIYPDFDGAQSVKFGWLIIDGKKRMVKSASKSTTYDKATLMPTSGHFEVIDEFDELHVFDCTIVAGTPNHLWGGTRIPVCLAKWTYRDKSGWGDFQDVQYADFVLQMQAA